LSNISVQAQTVSVTELANQQPLGYVHLFVKMIEDLQDKGTYFVSDGKGLVNLPTDYLGENVYLRASFIGFDNYEDTLVIKELNKIALKEGSGLLDEVVVTAQYVPSSVNKSVHKIKVIDSKRIKELAAVNLKDVLNYELNIRLSQDNILGSSLSMQGLSGENVKIMIDGVPLIGRQNGNLDLSQINLYDVERIEMVEGPLSVNYGTNALAGTINIITKKKSTNKTNITVDAYSENIGTYNLSGNIAYNFKEKHRISISGGRNFFDGWSEDDKWLPDFKQHYADASRFKSWKPREQYFGRFQYHLNLKDFNLGYRGEIFKELITNRGLPKAPYNETTFDDTYKTFRNDHSIYGNGKISKNFSLNAVGGMNFYERKKNTYYKDLTTLEEQITDNASDQDTSEFKQWMIRAAVASQFEKSWIQFETGIDINHETAKGIRILDGKQMMGDYAVFASAEITPVKNLILRPGLRMAYNSSYKAPPIPSFNIKYSWKDFIVRASYAYGFRAPSLKELYFEFVDINHNIVGQDQLKAEYSHNYSANLQFSKWKKHILYKTEGNFFYNDVRNLITLAQVKEVEYTYVNIGRFKTIGGGLQQSFTWKWLNATAGLNYTGRYNELSEDLDIATFNFTPEATAKISMTWEKIGLSGAIFYKYQGKLPNILADTEGNIIESYIDQYHMADANITKMFWEKRIGITVGCKNIAGVKTVNTSASSGGVHSSGGSTVPMGMGRVGFVKLSFNYNK
jgi:outer membrane receptor for ferrienterochelin and colicins